MELAVELGYGQMALHVRQGNVVVAESTYGSIGYASITAENMGSACTALCTSL